MKFLILVFSLIIMLYLGFTMTNPKNNTMENTITADKLRQDVSILASDKMQGRYFSSEGYESAAQYAASKFKKAGLKTVLSTDKKETYFQQVSIEKMDFKSALTVSIRGKAYTFTPGEHFLFGMAPYVQKKSRGKLLFQDFH